MQTYHGHYGYRIITPAAPRHREDSAGQNTAVKPCYMYATAIPGPTYNDWLGPGFKTQMHTLKERGHKTGMFSFLLIVKMHRLTYINLLMQPINQMVKSLFH